MELITQCKAVMAALAMAIMVTMVMGQDDGSGNGLPAGNEDILSRLDNLALPLLLLILHLPNPDHVYQALQSRLV